MAEPIITITPGAAEQILFLINQRQKPSVGIKVKVKSGGCSGLEYKIEYADSVEKYDEVVTDKGVTVVIDPKAVMYLIGAEMDYKKDKMKEGFTFANPNEKGRCGCGESFWA